MITTYILPGAWDLPSVSPYCTKLLYFLDLVGIPYEIKPGDLRRAPQGKVPYIKHEGQIIGDTHAIIPYLSQKFGRSMCDDLSPDHLAQGHAAMRIAEDSLYWVIVYSRWDRKDGWEVLKPVVRQMLPPVVHTVLVPAIRNKVRKQLHEVGISRLSEAEAYDRGARDLDALTLMLGKRDFLGVEEITVFDVSVCAMLASILLSPHESPLKKAAQSRPELTGWFERFDDKRKEALASRS